MNLLRKILIALSRNQVLQDAIIQIQATRRMARRFVAGETLDDAIQAVLALNAEGMLATLDHLGENVANEAEAVASADEYLLALDALHAVDARCNVSMKLTQMGLDIGQDFCFSNVVRVVQRAAELGNFVRVDMEGSPYTTRTLDIYRRLRSQFDNVGIVIQTYLHRSQDDVEALIDEGDRPFPALQGRVR